MTSSTHFGWNCMNEWTKSRFEVVVTSYGRNKNRDDEIKKNIAGQVLTYNSKIFHWLNRKLDIKRTMSGFGKPFRKKSDPKNRKNSKIKVKLPHVDKKPQARKPIFVQTLFSHSTLKLKRKKFTPQNHSLFRSTSCLRDQNHYSNLTSKIMKMCEQILKKKTAPQYNSNSLNCKKNKEKANNSPSYHCAAIKKMRNVVGI